MAVKLMYKTPKGLAELDDTSFLIQPMEDKLFQLYVYGLQNTSSKLLTVRVQEVALFPTTTTTVSLKTNDLIESWKDFDTVLLNASEIIVPLYIRIQSRGYTEAATNLKFSIVLQDLKYVDINIDYYTNTVKGMYTYLSRPVEQTLSRILEINPVPEGSPYKLYLAYSNGSLILLDDASGIPYIEASTEQDND